MTSKPTNPKDQVGVKKWRQFFPVPCRVMWEVGVAMLEGARKYGRFNYREAGVLASIYVDAAKGHIDCWVEGEDLDPDTGLSHITKAIASLTVLRDGMLQGNFVDDRPPRHEKLDEHRAMLQGVVDRMFEAHPEPVDPFTELRLRAEREARQVNYWDSMRGLGNSEGGGALILDEASFLGYSRGHDQEEPSTENGREVE